MTIPEFTAKLKEAPKATVFGDTIVTIDQNYDFTPTAFQNGKTTNGAEENSGSCKIFAFAQLQNYTKEETLACFGAYYFDEVLGDPQGENHANIRNFMFFGWEGIAFEGTPLTAK